MPLLRQSRSSQAFRGYREILRLDQQPVIELANAQRGIEPTHVVHGLSRFFLTARQRMACGHEGRNPQDIRYLPPCHL